MITDEMVNAALKASDKTRRHLDPTGEKRMRAALEAAERAAWEPIETAPRDGTLIMVFLPLLNLHAVARWEEQKYHTKPAPYFDVRGLSTVDSRAHAPRYWRPLPAPPTEV